MGAPIVTIKEQDLSTVVPSFPGVYGYINIPGAKRGSVDEVSLVTNETQLLETLTPNDTVGIGYDTAYYSALAFLQKSNKLWVSRTVNNALTGGCVFPVLGSGASPSPISSGIADINAYVFGPDDLFLIYGNNPGEWNNIISVKALPNKTEPNAFNLQVYRNGALEEEWPVSRVEGQKDANGRNMYIEDVLKGSAFVRALDNTAKVDTLLPEYSIATSSQFTLPVETQAYLPGSNAIAKQVKFDVLTGNSTGVRTSMKVDAVNVNIEATDLTPAQVAARIAGADFSADATIDTVTYLGSTVTINFTEASGDRAIPVLTNNATTIATGINSAVTQAYIAPGTGATQKVVTFDVTAGPSGGNDEITIHGVAVALTDGLTPAQCATAIAAANYAAATEIDTVTAPGGATVNITYTLAAGDQAPSVSVTDGSDGTTIGAVSTSTPYSAGAAGTAKVIEETVTVANSQPGYVAISFDGVKIEIPASATTDQIASIIAATDFSTIPEYDTVTALGSVVTITYTLAAADHALPVLANVAPTTTYSSVATSRSYVPGSVATPEIQSVTITAGNSSNNNEFIYIEGLAVLIDSASTSTELVAQDIANADYSTLPTIDSVSAVGSNVLFTFTTVAGNVDPLDIQDAGTFATPLDKGSDGSPVTDSNMLQKLSQLNGLRCTVLLDGGRASAPYQKGLISLAETRQDCVAILSTPYASEAKSTYVNSILEYRNVTLNANTSYAALYTPHVLITDKYNDRQIYVAPDGFIGAIISETAAKSEIWFPPAGFRRGVLNVDDVHRRFTQGEMDVLYDAGINPIRFAEGRGITVWGQKTLLARNSSLNRMNVRLMLIVVEPAVRDALEDFVFEQNTFSERLQVKALIDSYMSDIKARGGVYDFYTKIDRENNNEQTIDNKKMKVWLFIKPVQAVEFIEFSPIITSSGVDFTQAVQALLAA